MDKYIKMDDGTKVFAQVEGTGKPIVLVHGWGLNHRMWDYQVPSLRRAAIKWWQSIYAVSGYRINRPRVTIMIHGRMTRER